jgi:hypothetical protein
VKIFLPILRVFLGVAIGAAAFAGGIWVLTLTLGNNQPTMCRGKTLNYWADQIYAPDATESNQANVILNAQIIPQLTNQMFCDTHDSKLRMILVDILNHLPGITIDYFPASERRAGAASYLGAFGPAAKAAIPALMQAVQSSDDAVHESAITALGDIHCEPELVIPFLTRYLDNDNVNDEAASALGKYGTLAQSAVPKIIPLLHADDDDVREAAEEALKKIDPAAYVKATKSVGK